MELRRVTYALEGGELTIERRYENDVTFIYEPHRNTSIDELRAMSPTGSHEDFIGNGLLALIAALETDSSRPVRVPLAVGSRKYSLENVMSRLEKRAT